MKNIYEKIENPFSRSDTLDKILEAYYGKHNFYSGLTTGESKNKVSGYMTTKDVTDFYLMIFKDWKDLIHRVRVANYLKEPYKSKIEKLDSYLQTVSPKTHEEVKNILFGADTNDEEIKKLLDEFRWNSLGEYSAWEHIDSSFINLGMHKRQEIEHRLYINCDSTKTHLIARCFIEKCKEIKSRFYFKYDLFGDRDDTLVIYSDTKHLPEYIRILNEIIRENDLSSAIHEPPLLTGRINGWIGYGSEPLEEKGKDLKSFNTKREEHLEKCIREETALWIKSHLNSRFRSNGVPTTYGEYFIEDIIKTVRENILMFMSDSEEKAKSRGYTRKEVESSFFDIALLKVLRENIQTIINSYATKKSFSLEVPFGKGTVRISSSHLTTAFKHQVEFISKHSKTFKQNLQDRILKTAHEFDIDKENYAVDISKTGMLGKGLSKPKTPIDIDTIIETKPKKEIKKQELTTPKEETPKQYQAPTQPKAKVQEERPKRKRLVYTPMTEAEIAESRRKLGFK